MGIDSLVIILVVSGFIIGLNPRMVSVFISLLAASFGKAASRNLVASIALAYLETLFLIYFGFGLLATIIFSSLNQQNFGYVGVLLGILLVGGGIFEIAQAYLKLNGGKVHYLNPSLHKHTTKSSGLHSFFIAPIIACLKNFRLTLLPIAAASYLLIASQGSSIGYLAILPLALIAPKVIIALLAYGKTKLSAIMKWKNDTSATFQTWAGVILVILGWLVWLTVNESL